MAGSLPLVRGLFDLVIIDEASQSDVTWSLLLLVRTKRAMTVGDPWQIARVAVLGEVCEGRIAEQRG